jgi:hypothetical protein
MTEQEWLACTDPKPMLEFLRGKASDRKLRLFACACGRRVWRLLKEADSRTAVEVAESFADGLERKSTLAVARSRARRAAVTQRGAAYVAWRAAFEKIQAAIVHLALGTFWSASYRPMFGVLEGADMADVEREQAAVAALLPEIFGNPFRPLPPKRGKKKWEQMWRSLLAWNDGTVVRLAQAAYDEGHLPEGTLDNNRLAVLADALEEAGCTSEDILGHLRGPGPHVRGCWPVDLCLGKS